MHAYLRFTNPIVQVHIRRRKIFEVRPDLGIWHKVTKSSLIDNLQWSRHRLRDRWRYLCTNLSHGDISLHPRLSVILTWASLPVRCEILKHSFSEDNGPSMARFWSAMKLYLSQFSPIEPWSFSNTWLRTWCSRLMNRWYISQYAATEGIADMED